MDTTRRAYPSDVGDEEWAFVAPYLTLMTEDAPQRDHELREAFNGLRWMVRAGAPWRLMPGDLPPWYTVYQQTRRWVAAGVFEEMVHDLRAVLRVAPGAGARADGGYLRRSHDAIDARERGQGGLRRAQEEERLEGA